MTSRPTAAVPVPTSVLLLMSVLLLLTFLGLRGLPLAGAMALMLGSLIALRALWGLQLTTWNADPALRQRALRSWAGNLGPCGVIAVMCVAPLVSLYAP